MGGFVVLREICFCLYHGSCAFSPNELRVNEFARAREWVAPEECTANELFFHGAFTPSRQRGPRQTTPSKALSWVINLQRYVARDRFAVTKRGNKLGFAKIGQSGVCKTAERRLLGVDLHLLKIAGRVNL